MKTKIILLLLVINLLALAAFSQSNPKTVSFPKGKNTVVLTGNTARENAYVFRLRTAKRVQISITSAKSGAFFSFDKKKTFDAGLDFMCEECQTMNERVGAGLWMISVFHIDEEPTDFILKISLK